MSRAMLTPSKHPLATFRKLAKRPKSKRREIEPARDAVWIDGPQVCRRYGGRSHMWLVRLLENDESFPRPMIVNRLRYWRVDEIVKWERAKAAASRAA